MTRPNKQWNNYRLTTLVKHPSTTSKTYSDSRPFIYNHIQYSSTTRLPHCHYRFPMLTINECFFHYTQCIWRKIQKCGLQAYYKENDDITKLVRRATVLPLVPQNKVEDVWFNALQDTGDADKVPDTTTYTDYVTRHWVETHIFLWNHYLTDGPRTTNHLEDWHNKIRKKVRHLRDHRLNPDHTSHDKDNYHPVCSRRSPTTQKTNLQTYRLQTSATERQIPPGVRYSDRYRQG